MIIFFLDYQPTLGFPPIKQSVVRAQVEQSQQINSAALPFAVTLPHTGYISTYFSWFHPGVDIATSLGTPIHPIAQGVVVDEGYNFWGLGNLVVVDHGSGFQSLYGHMGNILVKKGDKVDSNSILGNVGMTGHTTGPHTHLQISRDGKNIDPLTILPKF